MKKKKKKNHISLVNKKNPYITTKHQIFSIYPQCSTGTVYYLCSIGILLAPRNLPSFHHMWVAVWSRAAHVHPLVEDGARPPSWPHVHWSSPLWWHRLILIKLILNLKISRLQSTEDCR